MNRALRMVELLRPVADLERSRHFYTAALGFVEADDTPSALHPLVAAAWGGAAPRLLRLRLGAQTLLLAACENPPAPPDEGAEDPRFQHIAIITRDMAGAWQRLLAHGPLATISQGGPQRLPAASGGATAVKFRDPDGHPLELLAFAPGALPPRWAGATGGLTLGIDHSAVTVADAGRSADFYAREMGLVQRSAQRNLGPEQGRLDALVAPVVEVVALAPQRASPHLELLAYRFARAGRPAAGGPRSILVWQAEGEGPARLLEDPDQHGHLLLPDTGPRMPPPTPPSPAEAPIPSDEDPWLLWGPYLSERQWGTVREDASAGGDAWAAVSHDMARSFAYRWGEEGIGGVSDERQRLCLSLALWNGRDPILKERLFGLSNAQGNHGEDVKEVYHYLDNTPDHRYMRMLYRYPQAAFPYRQLVDENARRGRDQPEYELADTGVLADDAFFDVFLEYAKPQPAELLVRYTVHNRGAEAATVHLLPTLWLRADPDTASGSAWLQGDGATVVSEHPTLGRYHWEVEGSVVGGPDGAAYLFTDNATHADRIAALGGQGNGQALVVPDAGSFYKDGIDERVVQGRAGAVRPQQVGTKVAAWRRLEVPAGASVTLRLRLQADGSGLPAHGFGPGFDAAIAQARADADAFYAARQDAARGPAFLALQRQAWAGLLWNKQYYGYEVCRWIDGDPGGPALPAARKQGRNAGWPHLRAHDVMLMPDKWEYPWFAAWDLAFHCIALAPIDPAFAKQQLTLLLHDRYMHPNGQLPAYEWNFGDVNPPVQALAAWKVYQRDAALTGKPDTAFLRRVLHRLMLNFTWWVNREDRSGNNIFEGGFLGLDNVGVFDRSQPMPGGGELEQADGTSWMAMYALNLMRIAMELAQDDPVYEDLAIKFAEHFFHIAGAMANMGNVEGQGLWDEEDGFYYDLLRLPDGSARRLRLRTIAGLVPFFAVEVLDEARLGRLTRLNRHLDNFLHARPDLDSLVSHWREPSRDPVAQVGEDPPPPAAPTQTAGRSHLFSLLRGHRMKRVLQRLLDENEFLSPHGIRSVSRAYAQQAFDLQLGEERYALHYTPAESDSNMFGGNSNWRGPVWLPLNYLIVESLRRFHAYYGDDFQVECPTGSGRMRSIAGVADFLQQRLLALYGAGLPGNGRPGEAADADLPPGAPPLLFHEYFHGDTGSGLGASHQTGWTALLALL